MMMMTTFITLPTPSIHEDPVKHFHSLQFSQFQVPWYDNLGKATASSVGLEGAPYRDLGRPSSRSAMIGLRARTQSRKPAVVYHNSEEDLFPDFKARYALSSRIWLLLHTSFALST